MYLQCGAGKAGLRELGILLILLVHEIDACFLCYHSCYCAGEGATVFGY